MTQLDQTRKEDFLVRADLTIEERLVPSILCKVYLPQKPSEKPFISFQPTKAQYDSCVHTFRCGFHAETPDFSGKIDATLDAPTVYLKDMRTTHWGPDLVVAQFNGDPQHLRVARFLSTDAELRTRCRVTWWLSPNKMLQPRMLIQSSFLGPISMERVFRHTFRLERHLVITFDKHYRSESRDDQIVQWSFLVGTTRHVLKGKEAFELCEELLPKIDDFLLIVSLGSRTRTACVGWEAVGSRQITSYYRGELEFPTGDTEPSYRDGLVDVNDFREFVTTAYSTFRAQPERDPIRGAIHALVPGKGHALEHTFLSLFAALEMLLLDFRRRNSLELIMNEEDWGALKVSCRKFIKEQTRATIDAPRRSWMYAKLDELNRVPLRIVLDALCTQYHIELSDLWPLFVEGRREIGLADIRNMIIHGEPFVDRCLDAVMVATEHLKWTVERVLLGLLNWPAERTEISRNFLARVAYPMRKLAAAKQTLEGNRGKRLASQ